MRPKKDKRKSPQDVRNEKAASVEARRVRAEKAAALARREKLAAETQAKP